MNEPAEVHDLVGTEVIEREFERAIEFYDMDLDPELMSEERQKSVEESRRTIEHGMRRGKFTVDEEGRFVYHARDGKGDVVFHPPTGATLAAATQEKTMSDVNRMLADMTREPAGRFSRMEYHKDLVWLQAVFVLFFG